VEVIFNVLSSYLSEGTGKDYSKSLPGWLSQLRFEPEASDIQATSFRLSCLL